MFKKRVSYLAVLVFVCYSGTIFAQLSTAIQYSLYADINPQQQMLFAKATITTQQAIEIDVTHFDNIKF